MCSKGLQVTVICRVILSSNDHLTRAYAAIGGSF